MTPIGMPVSFCNAPEFGIRSVVTRSTDLSELNSSRFPPCVGVATYYYCYYCALTAKGD